MGRQKPNHGGSGLPHTRKSRPRPPPRKAIRYAPIETLAELDLYLSGAKIACLLCGAEYKQLGGHVSRTHSMSARDYKLMFNIPVSRSISCPDVRKRRSEIMQEMWEDNPKMEAIRDTCKERVKTFYDVRPNRSESTLINQINSAGTNKMHDATKEKVFDGRRFGGSRVICNECGGSADAEQWNTRELEAREPLWVDVKTEMPEPCHPVIIQGGCGYWNPKYSQWYTLMDQNYDGTDAAIEWEVTHWMRLPEAPDER